MPLRIVFMRARFLVHDVGTAPRSAAAITASPALAPEGANIAPGTLFRSFPFEFMEGGSDVARIIVVEQRPARALAGPDRGDGLLHRPPLPKEAANLVAQQREIAPLRRQGVRPGRDARSMPGYDARRRDPRQFVHH